MLDELGEREDAGVVAGVGGDDDGAELVGEGVGVDGEDVGVAEGSEELGGSEKALDAEAVSDHSQ